MRFARPSSGRSGVVASILRLAAPLAFVQLGLAVMSLTDTAFVGRASAADLAGVSLGNSIFFTVLVACMGVVLGIEPLVGQAVGRGDRPRARRAMRQSVLLSLASTVPGFAALGLVLWALPSLGIDADVIAPTKGYVLGRMPGFFPTLLFFGLRGYLQGHNITRPAVISTLVAVVVNVPADALLVFGDEALLAVGLPAVGLPVLGATGAGFATSLVNVVQAVFLAEPVRRLSGEAGERGWLLSRWTEAARARAELWRILRVGMPMGWQFAFEVAFFSSVSFLMGRMGALQLASHHVALTLASAPFQCCLGIGSAAGVVVGQRIGAGDPGGALHAGRASIGIGFAFMSLTGACFLLFPEPLVRVFTNDAEVIPTAAVLIRVAGFFALSDGVQAVASGALRGAGDTAWPFAIHLLAHWAVGMPAALLFAYVLDGGAVGLWWGLTVGLTVSAVALTSRFFLKARRGYTALEGGA